MIITGGMGTNQLVVQGFLWPTVRIEEEVRRGGIYYPVEIVGATRRKQKQVIDVMLLAFMEDDSDF